MGFVSTSRVLHKLEAFAYFHPMVTFWSFNCFLYHHFLPFQLTRFLDVLRLAADLADLLLHCAIVGRHAGYAPLLRSERPHGPPVLQLTQPLPLLRPNHVLRLSLLLLFFLGTFLTPVRCTYFAAFYQSPRPICRWPRPTIARIPCLHLSIASISFRFLLGWHQKLRLFCGFVAII